MLGQHVLIRSYSSQPALSGYIIDDSGNFNGMVLVWLEHAVSTVQGNIIQAIHVEISDLTFTELETKL